MLIFKLKQAASQMILLGLLASVLTSGTPAQATEKENFMDGLANLPALLPVKSCTDLTGFNYFTEVGAKVIITQTEQITLDGQDYCAVKGAVEPNIGFEFRLPMKGWTQRYLQTGCGGLCGILEIHADHAEGCIPYENHSLVMGSTDMGHQGTFMGDGTFGSDPQSRIDFAYRGVHLTALLGKALISNFYGKPATYSYFAGCSDGGREALMEAQRFPNDFNGISAGAPAMNFQIQNSFYHAWQASSNTDSHGKAILTAEKLPALHAAVLSACDGLDGLEDGLIADPRQCKFDPIVIQCKKHQKDNLTCLSAIQVEVVRKLYVGAHDEQGQRFVVGGPQYGSELAWRGLFVPDIANQPIPSKFMALGSLQNLIFEKNPEAGYDLADFHFNVATFEKLRAMHSMNDATDPDLSAFAGMGHKLILWHGWSDQHISPINSIAYYTAMQKLLGADKVADFSKLFLFPGMYHCNGGDGVSDFDMLTPLMRWTESDIAPQSVVAKTSYKMDGPSARPNDIKAQAMNGKPPVKEANAVRNGSDRTRIVFAYPYHAKYKGSGSINDPANYRAALPRNPEPEAYDWLGAQFMRSGLAKQCSVVDGALQCI